MQNGPFGAYRKGINVADADDFCEKTCGGFFTRIKLSGITSGSRFRSLAEITNCLLNVSNGESSERGANGAHGDDYALYEYALRGDSFSVPVTLMRRAVEKIADPSCTVPRYILWLPAETRI